MCGPRIFLDMHLQSKWTVVVVVVRTKTKRRFHGMHRQIYFGMSCNLSCEHQLGQVVVQQPFSHWSYMARSVATYPMMVKLKLNNGCALGHIRFAACSSYTQKAGEWVTLSITGKWTNTSVLGTRGRTHFTLVVVVVAHHRTMNCKLI